MGVSDANSSSFIIMLVMKLLCKITYGFVYGYFWKIYVIVSPVIFRSIFKRKMSFVSKRILKKKIYL